ncbi:MAG: DUF2933 domain-containing protein [Firmicutes bacterium]|nr:DUF2933 domain-containing protein [Bacillota bacterium]
MRLKHVLIGALCCLALTILAGFLASRGIGMGWLLFLLCPAMHLFMMKGMPCHGHDRGPEETSEANHLDEAGEGPPTWDERKASWIGGPCVQLPKLQDPYGNEDIELAKPHS